MDLATLAKTLGVLVYMAALVYIGVRASRRMGDVSDYFAGGKKFSYWAAAFSARATGESAWLLLGLTGMGAAIGVKAFWVVLGEALGVGAAWLLMCRRFKRLTDVYDAITVPDYLEARFADGTQRLRKVAAGALVVFVTIYVSAQIDATGTAFETFLGLDYFLGALIGFSVVMAYIVSGGFVAVVWSDVFQGALMFVGLVSLPIVGLVWAGGPEPVIDGLRAIDPHLLHWAGTSGWGVGDLFEIAGLTLIGLGFLGSPQIFVRFLALRDEDEVPRGAAVALTWTLLAEIGAVCTGLIGRHLLTAPGDDLVAELGNGGQDVLPALAEAVLPALVVGIFIAVVLSAIMSTIDSLLVVASSALVRDWYQKVAHPDIADDALIPMCRKATVGLAAVALTVAMIVAISTPDRTIFWFVIFGWSGIAATFCPTIILSLAWRGMTADGALVAMITGFVGVPAFKFGLPAFAAWAVDAEWYIIGEGAGLVARLGELPPAFVVSMAAGVAVSLLRPVDPAVAASFDHDVEALSP